MQGVGLCLGQRGELGQAVGLQRRIGDHDVGHLRHDGDQLQVLGGLVVQRLVHAIGRVQANGAEQQRIAVRPGIRHELAADVAAGAWTVLHDHRLPIQLAQVFGQQAALDIGTAARREGHDDAHGAVGIVGLGLRGERQGGTCERQAQGLQEAAAIHGHFPKQWMRGGHI